MPARPGRGDGVEHHRGRIAAFLRDHGDAVALAPDRQLLAGRRAERVAGGEQHRQALRLEVLGELADRRGLAGAVDAGQHDDERPRGADDERLLERRERARAAPP